MEFLEKNPDEADRVGRIEGVLHKGAPTTIYFVLVGAGAFVNHFQGVRRFPNVKLVFEPTKGFNKGALRFVASTRNKQGVGQTEFAMNYGLDFDVSSEYPKNMFIGRALNANETAPAAAH